VKITDHRSSYKVSKEKPTNLPWDNDKLDKVKIPKSKIINNPED